MTDYTHSNHHWRQNCWNSTVASNHDIRFSSLERSNSNAEAQEGAGDGIKRHKIFLPTCLPKLGRHKSDGSRYIRYDILRKVSEMFSSAEDLRDKLNKDRGSYVRSDWGGDTPQLQSFRWLLSIGQTLGCVWQRQLALINPCFGHDYATAWLFHDLFLYRPRGLMNALPGTNAMIPDKLHFYLMPASFGFFTSDEITRSQPLAYETMYICRAISIVTTLHGISWHSMPHSWR